MLGQTGESVVGNHQAYGRIGGLSQFSETSQGVQAEPEGRLEIFLPPGRRALSLGLSKEEVIFGSCGLPSLQEVEGKPPGTQLLLPSPPERRWPRGGLQGLLCSVPGLASPGEQVPPSARPAFPGAGSPEPRLAPTSQVGKGKPREVVPSPRDPHGSRAPDWHSAASKTCPGARGVLGCAVPSEDPRPEGPDPTHLREGSAGTGGPERGAS